MLSKGKTLDPAPLFINNSPLLKDEGLAFNPYSAAQFKQSDFEICETSFSERAGHDFKSAVIRSSRYVLLRSLSE